MTAVHDGDLGEGGSCEFLGLCLRKVVRDFVSCLLFQADVDVKGQQSLPACIVLLDNWERPCNSGFLIGARQNCVFMDLPPYLRLVRY